MADTTVRSKLGLRCSWIQRERCDKTHPSTRFFGHWCHPPITSPFVVPKWLPGTPKSTASSQAQAEGPEIEYLFPQTHCKGSSLLLLVQFICSAHVSHQWLGWCRLLGLKPQCHCPVVQTAFHSWRLLTQEAGVGTAIYFAHSLYNLTDYSKEQSPRVD